MATTATLTREGSDRPIVLVHGAWHGGWCWADVAALLRAEGRRVFAPSLTGLADRAHLFSPAIDLDTHIADIANLIAFERLDNVTLVGHSYAGHVIEGACDRVRQRLARLVHLDSVRPVDGQPFIAGGRSNPRVAALGDAAALPVADLAFLGIPEDHPAAKGVIDRLTPHPLGTLTQTFRYRDGPPDVPRTYIRCTGSAMFAPGKDDEIIADPGWDYRTLDTGHEAMITAPVETARMLLDIVAG